MYPNTYYRVAAKAIITDEKGRVLVVRESNDIWGLPGGGLDHGELPHECIKREISEELGANNTEVGEIITTKTFYLDQIDAWMIWVVYKAKLDSLSFIFGDGVTDAKFVLPQELENSEDMFERAVSEFAEFIN